MADKAIVHTETWAESIPAGTEAKSLGDDRIRAMKKALGERWQIDHVGFVNESGETLVGTHKQVTMAALAADPTSYDNVGYVYTKTMSGIIELFYEDSSGNVLQITKGGKLILDGGYLPNNTFLQALNAAGNAYIDMIKVNASNKPVLPDGAQLATSAAPTQDADISNKKFVDDSKQVAKDYADTQIAAAASDTAAIGSAYVKDTIYQNTSAKKLLVIACFVGKDDLFITGYCDANAAPSTIVDKDSDISDSSQSTWGKVVMVVPPNYYWKVAATSSDMTPTVVRYESFEI